MDNLKIPYGMDRSSTLVSAEMAEKGAQYTCPCCNAPLIYRAGDVREKHFAHPADSNCNLETILHITAKRLICEAMKRNASEGAKIILENHCLNCGVILKINLPPGTFVDSLAFEATLLKDSIQYSAIYHF